MKILAVGDIIGISGAKKAKNLIPIIKKEENIDFVIVNGENAAEGFGITKKIFDDLIAAGTDVVTMGNHTWAKKEIFTFIDNPQIVRPANYSKGLPGKGYNIYECNGKKIAVMNLIGRTTMGILSENPFIIAEEIIEKIRKEVDIIIIDFHAEATAEKIALAHYLDGKANIVFGTHTHVQTADEMILPKGTAYITDLGKTGPINSVIGMDVGVSFKRFITSMPERYKVADGECSLNSCIFEIDDEDCRIKSITRYNR